MTTRKERRIHKNETLSVILAIGFYLKIYRTESKVNTVPAV